MPKCLIKVIFALVLDKSYSLFFTNVTIDCTETSSICGTRGNEFPSDNYGKYIISGENARPGAWPWHVQIFHYGEHICGGSIISEQWILTAAHCLQLVRHNN